MCDQCWGALLPSRGADRPSYVQRIIVGFAYDSTLRSIVHRFKFEGGRGLALPLAGVLDKRLHFTGQIPQSGILLPVPSHTSRLRERGFNPAEEIARHLANHWGIEARPELAKRTIAGAHQSSLPDERRKNTLEGAFRVKPPQNDEANAPLILFDDVIHTGNTLRRLGEAAKRAGWKRIEAICLCK